MLKILNKKFILLVLLFLCCYGCSTFSNNFGITSTSGVYIYEDKLKKIYPGIYQTQVYEILGPPTFTSIFNKDKWFYVNQQTWYIAIFKEKLIKQQIIILTFDTDGRLTTITQKSLNDTLNIDYNNDHTNFYYQKKYIKPDLF